MRRAARGFSLLEMLAVIVMIAAFTLVSARLFHASMRWSTSARRQTAADLTLDAAVSRLRADVWNCYAVALGDERTAVLRHAGDRSTTWVITDRDGSEADGDGAGSVLTRRTIEGRTAGDARSWRVGGAHVRMKPTAGGLRVLIEPVGREQDAEPRRSVDFELWSQLILNREGRP